MTQKAKEVHVWLDLEGWDGTYDGQILDIAETVEETLHLFESTGTGIIHTIQPIFLSNKFAEKIFVHMNGDVFELFGDEDKCVEFISSYIYSHFGRFDFNYESLTSILEVMKIKE